MSDKVLSTFKLDITEAVKESLHECLAPPVDVDEDGEEVGEPDWSIYDDVMNHIIDNIMIRAADLVTNLEALQPQVSSKKGTKKDGTKRNNTYTRWVRVASKIRKNKLPGDQQVTVTANFSNNTTASATKYFAIQDDLELEGETMSIKDLLEHLKSSMQGEKDLTLTAICWGLMPKEFRENLVVELDV